MNIFPKRKTLTGLENKLCSSKRKGGGGREGRPEGTAEFMRGDRQRENSGVNSEA